MTKGKLPAFRVQLKIFTRFVFKLVFKVWKKCSMKYNSKFWTCRRTQFTRERFKYLLVQIQSSDSLFWVGFVSCGFFYFLKKNFMAPFYRWGSTAFWLQSFYVLISNSEKYTLAHCALSINDYSNSGSSIHFHKFNWYEVEIRLSDDPRQKETIDGIIWLRRKV